MNVNTATQRRLGIRIASLSPHPGRSYKVPYVLPSSVCANSFVSHSYENYWGVPSFFPIWNRSNRHVLPIAVRAFRRWGRAFGLKDDLLRQDDGGAAGQAEGAGGVAFVHRNLDEAAGTEIGEGL